ncbi:MAG: DUF1573 domain-containing protein [Planctomycetota bacterium]
MKAGLSLKLLGVVGLVVGLAALFLIVLLKGLAADDSRTTETASVLAPFAPVGEDFVGFLEPVLDLGEVPWATEQFVSLPFVNQTAQPVTIDSITSTCGCVLAHDASAYQGRVVTPGSELAIEVGMETGKKLGRKRAHIELGTTSGRSFGVLVRAWVVGSWDLSADEVHFGKVFFDDPADPVMSVVFSSESDRVAATPEADAPWLVCSRRSGKAGDGGQEIELRIVKDKLSPGVNSCTVEVRTTNQTTNPCDYRITGYSTESGNRYEEHQVAPGGCVRPT